MPANRSLRSSSLTCINSENYPAIALAAAAVIRRTEVVSDARSKFFSECGVDIDDTDFRLPAAIHTKFGRRQLLKTGLLASSAFSCHARLAAREPGPRWPPLAAFAPDAFAVDPGSMIGDRMRSNAAYLLSLDLDRLLYSFHQYARLPVRGALPYGGWEAPQWGTRGHFVGHYLSAISKAAVTMLRIDKVAADALRERSVRLVASLAECQAAIAKQRGVDAPGRAGYLNAQSPAQFDRLEALQPCDVPYYQIHKIMAGLLDAFTLTANHQALFVARGMADYFAWRMDRLTDKRIAAMTETRRYTGATPSYFMEFGAMQDVLLALYRFTGDAADRRLAARFDRPWFREMLAEDRDELGQNGEHANTEIANVLGLARQYEIGHDPLYRRAVLNFLGWMADGHQFANGAVGGTSAYPAPLDYGAELFLNRHFLYRQVSAAPAIPNGGSTSGGHARECGESCCSHNLNRLTRYAIRWTGAARWGDEFEKRFVNAVLAQQHPATAMLVYNLNLAPGSIKRFGTPEHTFWCCYGSGVEAFADPADGSFFHDGDRALWVSNFVAGTLTWREAGITLIQQTAFPDDGHINLQIKTSTPHKFTLHVRIPNWAAGAALAINGSAFSERVTPGSFVAIHRRWIDGDTVALDLPFTLRTEPLVDQPDLVAVHYGPHHLVACTAGEAKFDGDSAALVAALAPTRKANIFRLGTDGSMVIYRPIHAIVDETYAGYTRLTQPPRKQSCDAVVLRDASSRAAHRLTIANGIEGEERGVRWIEASGVIEVRLKVHADRPTYLHCRYSGDDVSGQDFVRVFDMSLVGMPADEVFATQSIDHEAPGGWHDVLYPLPEAFTHGRSAVTVRFEPKGFEHRPGRVGRLFDAIRTHTYA